MACGWAFALVMAVLPLFGVSDYRKFAICLPFETTTGPVSLAYVVFLMLINGVAFLILMGCYLKMYCAIRGSQVRTVQAEAEAGPGCSVLANEGPAPLCRRPGTPTTRVSPSVWRCSCSRTSSAGRPSPSSR